MKKQFITVLALIISAIALSQYSKDLFNSDTTKISWLGIDFSHVKLIGDFSQFYGAGEKNHTVIRDKYFPAWNLLVLAEPNKYDIKGMLRRNNIFIDIDMLMGINSSTPVKSIESYNTPKYTLDDVKRFVSEYKTENKKGIGVLFIAECLNKNAKEAFFHFVAINMNTKEILIHERIRGKPRGFGIRNYWGDSNI